MVVTDPWQPWHVPNVYIPDHTANYNYRDINTTVNLPKTLAPIFIVLFAQ